MKNFYIGFARGADCCLFGALGYAWGAGSLSLGAVAVMYIGWSLIGETLIRLFERRMGVIYP